MREAGNNPIIFTLTLLAIEFLDEFAFAARETAWPLIRTDVSLRAEGEAIPQFAAWGLLPFDRLRTGIAPLLAKQVTTGSLRADVLSVRASDVEEVKSYERGKKT